MRRNDVPAILTSDSVTLESIGATLVVDSSKGYLFLYARYPKYAATEAIAATVKILNALSEVPISEIAFKRY